MKIFCKECKYFIDHGYMHSDMCTSPHNTISNYKDEKGELT